ncbi:Glu/Leu/Phe/Val dehydrogenase dimerization domain-containing protein [Chondromyces apiculatus]|uniref:Leucine dehydrogenase n=1 Tax=Chondromyces apiculatus DSM 436 TaxID=1192034 RepID=A0A017TEE9_9BACT|nr:Glu/Leu/Phe/Val dehydrogenase dimerization domain-containing protein [Chondromyces apiculatus]EYF06976.1 Leucine dehydrogenase [Chondromyces apiculatus DSM 436]
MQIFDTLASTGHEQVLFCQDPGAGYRAILAIHSTVLGPAIGGTRVLRYADEAQALDDALRLSAGMTYKNALAGMPAGGGKAVILLGDAPPDREALFRAHGRFIERLGGTFITGEDVGTSPADMEFIRRETRHVKGLPDGMGDPSPWTARGVFQAMRAAAHWRWGSADLAGKRVALQGCGHVGAPLARALSEAGARLVVADVDAARAEVVARETGAEVTTPASIARVSADIFAPCALGAVLDDASIPDLQVEVVVGAANNQLRAPRHADALAARGILYIPDYMANAGGVLSGGVDLFDWPRSEMQRRVDGIHDTVLAILESAVSEGILPSVAADRIAERRIEEGRQRRSAPPAGALNAPSGGAG